MRICVPAVFLIHLLVGIPSAQDLQFNSDSAYVYTRILSSDIGPRPMGSPAEQHALDWTVTKFQQFGADTSYVMRFYRASRRSIGINTTSGVAVGVFRGKTDSTIVIGGHIDSLDKDTPGANDDASGTACMIELARTWSGQKRHYTMVFAAFGGEEYGLIGSHFFVNNYEAIDKVALMLQLDMAASEDPIILFIESKHRQAPQWLVEDTFAAARGLGHDISYPFNFFSLNNTFSGAGSDHQPFLDEGIPAIDLTAGINGSAIHTPGDQFQFTNKKMLQRTGDIINALITKYQENGIPKPRTESYFLLSAFGIEFFIPSWLITTAVVVCFLTGIAAFGYSRSRRLQISREARIRYSGSKLLLMLVIIALSAQLGEAAIQALTGIRYPWFIFVDQYLFLSLLCAISGSWLALQLTRKWSLSPDPYVYSKRALGVLFFMVIIFAFGGSRFALYPAISLVLVSLVIMAPNEFLRISAALLAPVPMLALLFHEVFTFMARTGAFAGIRIDTALESFLTSTILTLLLVLWFLPFIYMSALLARKSKLISELLRLFRQPAAGLAALIVILAYGNHAMGLPAYDDLWKAEIRVQANYDLKTKESNLQIAGNEFFRGVSVYADSVEKSYDEGINRDQLPMTFSADWVSVDGGHKRIAGEVDTLSLDWWLTTTEPWHRVQVDLKTDTLSISDISSKIVGAFHNGQARFIWYADPADTLRLRASLILPKNAQLIREVKATYAEMPIDTRVTSELARVTYETVVARTDTIQ